MRPVPAGALVTLLLAACGSGRREPAPTAAAANVAPPVVANRSATEPPLPVGTHVACDRMIDTARFTTALGESATVELVDRGAADAEAAASCSLVKAGVRPDERAQTEMMKKTGRLGALPGDELCLVTAYCWTIETEATFLARCRDRDHATDTSVADVACVQVIAQGADDVNVYRLLDDDTGCVLSVRGGPAVVDNAFIAACATAARTYIGPDQIAGAP